MKPITFLGDSLEEVRSFPTQATSKTDLELARSRLKELMRSRT